MEGGYPGGSAFFRDFARQVVACLKNDPEFEKMVEQYQIIKAAGNAWNRLQHCEVGDHLVVETDRCKYCSVRLCKSCIIETKPCLKGCCTQTIHSDCKPSRSRRCSHSDCMSRNCNYVSLYDCSQCKKTLCSDHHLYCKFCAAIICSECETKGHTECSKRKRRKN